MIVGNVKVIVTGEISDSLRLMPRFAEEDYQSTLADAFFGANSIEAWFLSKLSRACKSMHGPFLEESIREFNANVPGFGVSPTSDSTSIKACLVGLLRYLNSLVVASLNDELADHTRVITSILQVCYVKDIIVVSYIPYYRMIGVISHHSLCPWIQSIR